MIALEGKKMPANSNPPIAPLKNKPNLYLLRLIVKPNSKRDRIFMDEFMLCIEISVPPVKNQANIEIIKLLAKKLKIGKSQVTLVHGQTSHEKVFELLIENTMAEQILQKLLEN
jgi:uncharacterized protein (TIGR00251 family)